MLKILQIYVFNDFRRNNLDWLILYMQRSHLALEKSSGIFLLFLVLKKHMKKIDNLKR